MRNEKTWSEISHEEIVASIRKDMAAYIAEKKPYKFDPVAWMRERFISARTALLFTENPERGLVARHESPHAQLLMAWDVISQPYYKTAYHRGLVESTVKTDARHLGHTITLDPKESMLLDAMAEAVGIPNTYRQLTGEKKV